MASVPPDLFAARRGRRPPAPDGQSAPSTFTSSLSIPAPGALTTRPAKHTLPVLPPIITNIPPIQPPPVPPKRAARKSKVDALAAIAHHHSSPPMASSSTAPPLAPPPSSVMNAMDIPTVSSSTPLDLTTVNTQSPRNLPPRASPRPFGLEEAPTYFPSLDEFQDPMQYIASIREEAEKYGICKIVPPEEWKMPFVTDTKTFRFKTRVQRLNSIEASSRAKLNFLEQLYRFHDHGSNPPNIPTISYKPVDLWLLRKEVHKLGGYENVCRTRSWGDVGKALGYDVIQGISSQLKSAYSRLILPLDNLLATIRGTSQPYGAANRQKYATRSTSSPQASRMGATHAPVSTSNATSTAAASASPAPSSSRAPSPKQSEITLEVNLDDSRAESPLTPLTDIDVKPWSDVKLATTVISSNPTSELPPGENCELCKGGDNDLLMMLCDGCDRGFHIYCLNPPLTSVPKGSWFCNDCLFDTDYGFDEGEDHSLASFQARAEEFRRLWFEAHPPKETDPTDPTIEKVGNVLVSEDDVEREFWRLVGSPYDSVEVEYGADVHSTTHGSAMPTTETHPLEEYSRSPWNLNNMPIHPDSLLRYIKSDISGMTVPWTYVGMVFSTFCWHNEDHYTYSINYMHWGNTKTWYGIPGEDAEKFEAAIKSEAPELFEAQPDLLFQLVTLMNPGRIREAGVRCYAANQRAGEFVVTFPKAYHCGFNHGFNFNEAVNFALPDWLPFGYSCAKRYQEHQKAPVFSHDELLLTINDYSKTAKTAAWLYDSLKQMTEREVAARQRLRAAMPTLVEHVDAEDRPEEQYQCSICKVFCYLSQFTCFCTSAISCLDHAETLCTCEEKPAGPTLRMRFNDTGLSEVLESVRQKHDDPADWVAKLLAYITDTPRPNVKQLRSFLQEADSIGVPPSLSADLRRFVSKCNDWINAALVYVTRKPQGRRRTRKAPTEVEPTDQRTLAAAEALLAEADSLGFDCLEVGHLQAAIEQSSKVRDAILESLRLPSDARNLAKFEALLNEAQMLGIKFPEIQDLESALETLRLLSELDRVDDGALSLDRVEELLARAKAANMDSTHEYYITLETKATAGREWDKRANDVLTQKPYTLDVLNELAQPPSGVPTPPKTLAQVVSARNRGRELEKQAIALLSTSSARKPIPQEGIMIVTRAADFSIPAVDELKGLATEACQFSDRYLAIANRTWVGEPEFPIDGLFEHLAKWRLEYIEKYSMFTMKSFATVEADLQVHQAWLRALPFYREGSLAEAYQVLLDVVEGVGTVDELPPGLDCTCICTKPVQVLSNGPTAVQCDSCSAKFHESCIKGSCPFCDHQHWDGTIEQPRNYSLGSLTSLLYSAPDLTRRYSGQYKLLETAISAGNSWIKSLDPFLKTLREETVRNPSLIARVRHVMRKLYKVQFRIELVGGVNPTYGAELAYLHRELAALPSPVSLPPMPIIVPPAVLVSPPKLTFSCEQVGLAEDDTECVCEGKAVPQKPTPLKPIKCSTCRRSLHLACVGFVPGTAPRDPKSFVCPICCAKKGAQYPPRFLRVLWPHLPAEYDVDYETWIKTGCQEIPVVYRPFHLTPISSIVLRLVSFVHNGFLHYPDQQHSTVPPPPKSSSSSRTPSAAASATPPPSAGPSRAPSQKRSAPEDSVPPPSKKSRASRARGSSSSSSSSSTPKELSPQDTTPSGSQTVFIPASSTTSAPARQQYNPMSSITLPPPPPARTPIRTVLMVMDGQPLPSQVKKHQEDQQQQTQSPQLSQREVQEPPESPPISKLLDDPDWVLSAASGGGGGGDVPLSRKRKAFDVNGIDGDGGEGGKPAHAPPPPPRRPTLIIRGPSEPRPAQSQIAQPPPSQPSPASSPPASRNGLLSSPA